MIIQLSHNFTHSMPKWAVVTCAKFWLNWIFGIKIRAKDFFRFQSWADLKGRTCRTDALMDWLISQIPQFSGQISHNAPFCNRNVYAFAHFCYTVMHYGTCDWCILGFVQLVYCPIMAMYMSQLLSLLWCHNECDGISNHRCLDCVCSGADQRKHRGLASLAFVRGIHRWPVDSPNKWPVTWKMFPFDDVLMVICHLSALIGYF